MEAPANTTRFFGSFDSSTPGETGQSKRGMLSVMGLRRYAPRGTGCAYSPIMFGKTENMNKQNNGRLAEVTAADFKGQVLEAEQPVLVEFWAPWSRPCQVLDSMLLDVAAACAGNVKVVKVNADDNLDLSLWYDIQSVPTLLCFVRGNPCLRIVGTASKEAVLAKLKPLSV